MLLIYHPWLGNARAGLVLSALHLFREPALVRPPCYQVLHGLFRFKWPDEEGAPWELQYD